MTDGASQADVPSPDVTSQSTSPRPPHSSSTPSPLVDAPAEAAPQPASLFNRLTRLAVRLLRVPMALVSISDGEGDTLVSQVGLPPAWTASGQNPLYTLERWQTINRGEIVQSSNAQLSVADGDASDMKVGAYLGVPLLTSTGRLVGCLCVIDTQPRDWTLNDMDSLKDLAASAATEIELRAVVDAQRQEERAQRFLAELAEQMRDLDDPDELLWMVVQRVGEFLGVSRCLFSAIDFHMRQLTILRDYHRDLPSLQGVYPSGMLSAASGAMVRQGHTVVIDDVARDERSAAYYAETYGPRGIAAYVTVPLMREGACVATFWVSDGQPRHWTEREVALVQNVAERAWLSAEKLRAEAARYASETSYRGIFEVADVGIAMTELDTGRFLYVNPKLCAITGYTPAEMLTLTFGEITHPDDRASNWTLYRQLAGGETPRFTVEKRYRAKDGRSIDVHIDVAVMRDGEGRPQNGVAVIHDITQRKRMEAALTTSEANYRALNEAIPAIVFASDADGGCVYVNQHWLEYTGLTPEASQGYGWSTVIHPDDQAAALESWQAAVRAGAPYEMEYRVRSATGAYRWFLGRAAPLHDAEGQVLRWLGVVTDIHDGKMATETHRFVNAVYEKMRAIDDPEELMTAVAAQLGHYLNLNRATLSDVDLDRQQVIIHPDFHRDLPSVSGVHGIFDHSSQTSESMLAGRTVVVHNAATDPRTRSVYAQVYQPLGMGAYITVPLLRDGRWAYTLSVSVTTPRQWSSDEVRLVEAIAARTWLMVERRRAEKALRESEAILRSYYTSAPVLMGLVELTDDGDILHVYDNPAACRFFGLPEGGTARQRASEMGVPAPVIAAWREHYRESQARAGVVEFEHEDRGRETLQWLSVAVSPVASPAPGPARFCYVAQDITARKQAEMALRESEERLRLALDAGQMGVWEWEAASERSTIDQRVRNLLALPPSNGADEGARVVAAIHPEDRAGVQEALRQSLRDIQPYQGEYRIRRPDGAVRWIASAGQPLVDRDGQTARLVGVLYDITERKQAEEALRQSEQHLRNVIDGLFAFVGVMTPDGILIEANRTALQAANLASADVIGKPFDQTYWWSWSPETQAQLRAAIERAAQGEPSRYDVVVRLGDDRFITIDFMLAPLFDERGHVNYLVPSAIDITDRIQATEALRASEERFRQIAENINDVFWITEPRHDAVVYVSPAFESIWGFPAEALYRDSTALLQSVHPDDRERARHRFETGITDGHYSDEYRIIRPDGSVRWIHDRAYTVRDETGQVYRIVGLAADITYRKQAEAALRESRELAARRLAELETTYRYAPVGLCVLDRDLRYARINERLAEINGIPAADHIGRTVAEIVPGIATQIEPAMRAVLDTGEPVLNIEIVGETLAQPGVQRTWIESWLPLVDWDGQIVGLNVVAQEVTEAKRAEVELRESRERATRSLAELEATYQSAPVGLCVFDRNLRWVRINQALADINSATVEAHLGRRISEVSPPLARVIEPILEQILATGEPTVNLELTGPRQGDPARMRTVLASWFPLRDVAGEIIGINAVVQDITDRKRAEAERERLLLREKAAREEAEAANRAKDEFLAVASHELRTPLTAILGWASALRSGRVKGDTATRAIQVIEQNAQVQAQLIEDILDFSRIITGKLNFNVEVVDLSQVVQAALDSVRLAASAKDIQIHTRLAPGVDPVTGDPDRLQQVAWNLLTNAVKFTPQGGQIFVDLAAVNGGAQLSVRDSGIGIAPDFLPYVFDRFRQADSSSTRKYGGLGLGLAIVRHIVEAHGGTIRAESAGPNQGATFTVWLPLETVEQGAADGGAPAETANAEVADDALDCPPALAGQRILIVEDEAHTRDLLCAVLQGCGVEAQGCASVEEALRAVADWWPTMVISDIGMPDEDGYSLMRKLRALQAEQGRELTSLALTAYARPQDRERAMSAGYDLFLAKPIEPDELLRRLAELVPS